MAIKSHTIHLPDGEITLQTGKLATLAAGSVTAQKGGTVILAAVAVDAKETSQDFFPLSVEYLEKLYARGIMSGSRMKKREGHPTDDAVIKARMIDHTLRPLFPKAFTRAVNVIVTVLADDGINKPEEMAVLASSAALLISEIPFNGPASGSIVGVNSNNEVVLNPTETEESPLLGHFMVSGNTGRLLNIEGDGHEVTNEQMDAVLDAALARIAVLNQAQLEFAADIAKPKLQVPVLSDLYALVELLKQAHLEEFKQALYTVKTDSASRTAEITKKLVQQYTTQDPEKYSEALVVAAVDYAAQQIMREGVMVNNVRLSGRGMEEIRPLSAEVDSLPTVHGAAIFNRGLTQSLSIATIAGIGKGETIDEMTGMDKFIRFMHHYVFPSYSTGEAGRMRYMPGRREIGHGAIGEHGILPMLPSIDEFPYSIRVVSEILTSNGSTSMAATCAASMALMAAGVPIKKAVGGIGVGLVTDSEDQQNYKLLLDIEGIEDFYGDMDFKVTGTDTGLTAIQFETKLPGVKPEIIKQAFRLSTTGRLQVLNTMNTAISQARSDLPATAPRVQVVQIPVEDIGKLIGPGGENIKKIVAEATAMVTPPTPIEINISDDGKVHITAVNKAQMDFAVSRVGAIGVKPEIGTIYDGVIDKVMPYGAFVNIAAGISGLIHVSELAEGFVKDPSEVVKEGDKVKVKLFKIENGKQSYSIKQAAPGYVPSASNDRGGDRNDRPQRTEYRNADRQGQNFNRSAQPNRGNPFSQNQPVKQEDNNDDGFKPAVNANEQPAERGFTIE